LSPAVNVSSIAREDILPSCFLSQEDFSTLDDVLQKYGNPIYTVRFDSFRVSRVNGEGVIKSLKNVSRAKTLIVEVVSATGESAIKMTLHERDGKWNTIDIMAAEQRVVNEIFQSLQDFFRNRKTHVHLLYKWYFQLLLAASFIPLHYALAFQLRKVFPLPTDLFWALLALLVIVGLVVAVQAPDRIPFANLQFGGIKRPKLMTGEKIVDAIVKALVGLIVVNLVSFLSTVLL